MMMSNKVYDVLKYIALVVLPALGTLYFALAKIWGFPYGAEIVGTITAVDAFLGALLQIADLLPQLIPNGQRGVGGCIAGGGQPTPIGPRTKAARLEGMYNIDKAAQIKLSNQNPFIQSLYDGLLKGKEHKLLHNHVHHEDCGC